MALADGCVNAYSKNVPGTRIGGTDEDTKLDGVYNRVCSSMPKVLQNVVDNFNANRGYEAISLQSFPANAGEMHVKAFAYLEDD